MPGLRSRSSGRSGESSQCRRGRTRTASVGGPRFDPGLSPEQRSAPSNKDVLCQNCAKLVDNDVLRFSVTLLNGWKADAEEEAQARIGKSIILSPAKGDVFMDVSVWNEEASSWKRGEELFVRYSIEREKDRIVIRHNLGYLTLFKNGGPIFHPPRICDVSNVLPVQMGFPVSRCSAPNRFDPLHSS